MVDDAEESEVRGERDEGQDPSDEGDHRPYERPKGTTANRDEEGDEGKAACDGVEYHNSSKTVGCPGRDGGDRSPVNLRDHFGRVVADVTTGADIVTACPISSSVMILRNVRLPCQAPD